MNTHNKSLARHLVETFSGITLLAALFLGLSPLAFNYPRSSELTTMSVSLGALIASLAACRVMGAYDARTISVLNMFLALITLAAPWLLHATQFHTFTTTHLTCGLIILLSSSTALIISHLFRPIETHPWLHS